MKRQVDTTLSRGAGLPAGQAGVRGHGSGKSCRKIAHRSLGICVLCAVFCSLCSAYAIASDMSLHGFIQGNYSADSGRSNPDGGDFKLAEERLQIKLDANKEPLHFFLKTDAFYDHVDEEFKAELREGYIDFTSSMWDVRMGRQVITWGLGDLIFINDVFPKDFEAFFSGRPMEYLKKGVDGVKIGMYPSFASAELIIIPFFEPNNYPDPKRFHMFDPLPSIANREEKEPAATPENTEIALRVYRDVAGFDTSLYFYRGFFRQPAMLPDSMTAPTIITLFYPKLSVYGASLQGRALDGVLSLEAGYYESRQDTKGTDPMIPNSQMKFLTGYQRQLWEDFNLGVQYYAEYMKKYSEYKINLPSDFPQEKRLSQLMTLRLTQLLRHQTLRLSFFLFYSPSYGDRMLNPEIKYNFSDNIWASVGVNMFEGGAGWNQFGQLDKNDNAYVQMRYEF
ncbi:MAG: hypothetical protein HY758_04965 [Nitrospirae bacterium]|nr:hypothetical protein [Nitrospirota bacterium]